MADHLFDFGDCHHHGPGYYYRLSRQASGIITTSVLGWLGVIHGIIFLIIANRLQWFRHHQFFLITNQISVGLLSTFLWAFGATRMLIYSPFPCRDIYMEGERNSDVLWCTILHFPANILLTCAVGSALITGIDHAYLSMAPISWLQSRKLYRWLLISFAWLWSIAQEGTWLIGSSLSYSDSECLAETFKVPISMTCQDFYSGKNNDSIRACCSVTELQCFRHTSAIPSKIYDQVHAFASVFDGITWFVALSALVVPLLIFKFFNSKPQENAPQMEEQQLQILDQARLVSGVMLVSYLLSIGPGSLIDIYENADFGINLIESFIIAMSMAFLIFAVYILAWKNEAFRLQLKKLLWGPGEKDTVVFESEFSDEKKVPLD